MRKAIISVLVKAYLCALLIFRLVASFFRLVCLRRYRAPLYVEKCTYDYIELSKGTTEILSIVHDNKKHADEGSDVIILFISGNPGYIRFYDRFLSELDRQLDGKVDIFGIGHLGQFNYPKKPMHNTYTLQDQVAQKAEYLKQLLASRPTAKVILISHSIGTYMALNIMDAVPREKVIHSIMLYPVIERINPTVNGQLHAKHPYFPYIYLSSSLIGLVAKLPMAIKRVLTKKYLESERGAVKEDVLDIAEAFCNYACYSSFFAMLYMTRSEFTTLFERQEEIIRKNVDRMYLYYGEIDDWCPKEYFTDIKSAIPEINAELDKEGFLHAFVIGGAAKKAVMIGEKVSQVLKQNKSS